MCGLGSRVMSNVKGSVNTSSSRLAEMYQRLIFSPALMTWPRTSKSWRALRRKNSTGDAQRRISSVAPWMCAGGSETRRSHWSGFSRNAFMPWAMALRVVSLPATDRSMKNRLKSISVRLSPSTSALSSVVTMSSRGSARRCSASCWAYMNIST